MSKAYRFDDASVAEVISCPAPFSTVVDEATIAPSESRTWVRAIGVRAAS